MKLRKVHLGDILDVKRGASLSGEYYSEHGDLIRLTLGNFNYPGGGFKENKDKKDIYFIGDVKDEFILKKGDIITPLTEQVSGLLGETARIPEDGKYIQSGDIGLVVPDESVLDKSYCYYLISSYVVKQQLDKSSQQTKIRHTSPDYIKRCVAWIPEDINDQILIGHTLDTLTSKVKNNSDIISELDALVESIYNYWFLQFDFPNENGDPYKSSGGKMVWNDELKYDIPDGWSTASLKDIFALNKKTISPTESQTKNFELYSIAAYDNGKFPEFSKGSNIKSNKFAISNDNILISKLNPSVKRIWRPYCITNNPICSTEFLVFTSKNMEYNVYNYAVIAYSAYSIFSNNSFGTTHSRSRVDKDAILNYKFALPPSDIIKKYCSIVNPIYSCIDNKYIENHFISKLRDSLHPMFVNGQIDFQ